MSIVSATGLRHLATEMVATGVDVADVPDSYLKSEIVKIAAEILAGATATQPPGKVVATVPTEPTSKVRAS